MRIPLRALGPARPGEPLRIELRLVYSIDEFPLPDRTRAEPTWATMISRELGEPALIPCAP